MMALKEGGILDQLYFNVLRPPAPQPLPKLNKDAPLNMEQLGTAAIVATVGFIIGKLYGIGSKLGEFQCKNGVFFVETESVYIQKIH